MRARAFVMLVAVPLVPLAAGCDDPTDAAPDIIVENGAGVSISEVYIRDCPVKFWGENRLESSEVVPPGERRGFGLGRGCYDVLLYFSTSQTIDRHNVDVTAGPYVWVVNNPDPVVQSPPARVATADASR